MGRVVSLTLLALALAPLRAAPYHPRTASKKPPAAMAAKKSTKATRIVPVSNRSSRRSLHVVSALRVAGHASRTGRGRYMKTAPIVHAAPAPTYQLHPDPDRYLEIQKALAERGYFKGEPNGEWSDESSDAMRRFQADQRIDNDGKIDALSLIALGLGPRHDGSTALQVTLQAAPPPIVSPIARSVPVATH